MPNPKRLCGKRPVLLAILLMALLTMSPYLPVLSGSLRLAGPDKMNNFLPWKHFLVSEIQNGRLPLWDFHPFSGYPFVANPQSCLFYPLDVFAFLMPLESFFGLFYALHTFLAALTMFLWLRRHVQSVLAAALGGLIWGWSGYAASNSIWGFTGLTAATVYLPLGMLFIERLWETKNRSRYFALTSATLSFQILAGHPQPVVYTFYFLLLYGTWVSFRKFRSGEVRPAKCAGMVALIPLAMVFSLLLSALVVLPAAEIAQFSATRQGGADYAFATHDSVPIVHLITCIAPFFFGDPTKGTFWETTIGYHEICGYMGVLPLILAVWSLSKRSVRRFFVPTAVACLVFALGSNTPAFRLLYWFVPGFQWFRVPGRILMLFNFCLAALASLGAADLLEQNKQDADNPARLANSTRWAIALLVCFECVLVSVLWFNSETVKGVIHQVELNRMLGTMSQISTDEQIELRLLTLKRFSFMRMATVQCIALTALTLGWFAVIRKKRLRAWASWAGLLALLIIDLGVFNWRLIPYMKPEAYQQTIAASKTVRFLQEQDEPCRVLVADDAISWYARDRHPELIPERLTMNGVQTVRGYNPTILNYYAAYINVMNGVAADAKIGGLLFLPEPKRMNREMLNELNAEFLVTYREPPPDFEKVLTDKGLGLYRNLKALPRAYLTGGSSDVYEPVRIDRYEPSLVEMSVNVAEPATLVLADVYYPGWTVAVDGEAEAILRYHSIFRSVLLEGGEHKVVFRFEPRSFQIGLFVSLICWSVLALILLTGRKRLFFA